MTTKIRIKLYLVQAALIGTYILQKSMRFILFCQTAPQCSALAIIEHNDMYLIKKNYFKKIASLPGGRIKQGENPYEAVIRQVAEKTELDILPMRLIGCYENSNANRAINMVFSGIIINPRKSTPQIKGKYCWISFDEAVSTLPDYCKVALKDYKNDVNSPQKRIVLEKRHIDALSWGARP